MGEIRERIARHFLDFFILMVLARGSSLSCYDLVDIVNDRFHMSLIPPTVYSRLHSLEDDGLIEGNAVQGKRVYALTEKGAQTAKTLSNMRDKILGSVLDLFVG